MENENDNYEQADSFYRMIEEAYQNSAAFAMLDTLDSDDWCDDPASDDWCDDAAFDSIGWGDDDAY